LRPGWTCDLEDLEVALERQRPDGRGGLFQHHDRASLLAGKLHAILQRPYAKGRDLYDLLWYLSDPNWPAPNMTLLNHALHQTGWDGEALTEDNWRQIIRWRLQTVPWEQVFADVRPLVESSADPHILTPENLTRVLAWPAEASS